MKERKKRLSGASFSGKREKENVFGFDPPSSKRKCRYCLSRERKKGKGGESQRLKGERREGEKSSGDDFWGKSSRHPLVC